ncbi:MAG TPA: hypothetical protein VFV68_00685, partial [Agriterribacter sp.]|nr:hypothetical protein [Agriterribacter sp.]
FVSNFKFLVPVEVTSYFPILFRVLFYILLLLSLRCLTASAPITAGGNFEDYLPGDNAFQKQDD